MVRCEATAQRINDIAHGTRSISADTAPRLSRYTGFAKSRRFDTGRGPVMQRQQSPITRRSTDLQRCDERQLCWLSASCSEGDERKAGREANWVLTRFRSGLEKGLWQGGAVL